MRRFGFVLLSLLSILQPWRTEAHPHVFIDTALTFRFDEAGRLAAVDVVWAFDDFSSMLMIEDMEMDPDGDDMLTGDEIARLAAMFGDWPMISRAISISPMTANPSGFRDRWKPACAMTVAA